MKYIVSIAILICSSISVLSQIKNSYVIKDQSVTDTPVSKLLYGNFIELGFGRSENAWSEMLYNRSFEEDKPFICEWVTYDKPAIEQENWWHSGYETPEWYLHKGENDKKSDFTKDRGYWPACHSETLISVINKSETEPVYFAQDGLFMRKNIAYHLK